MTHKGTAFHRTDTKARRTYILHVGVTEEWGARFAKEAKANAVPASSLAREILEEWLKRLEAERDARETA